MDKIELSPSQKKAQRNRSVAIGLVLGALVVLFYVLTWVKIGPGILNKGI